MCFNLGNTGSREGKQQPRTTTKKQDDIKENSVNSVSSSELSSLREIAVRIVHAGGREELFGDVISASNVLERYPGMVVAKPGIFKRNPNDSVLAEDDRLLPGQKYYIIPSTTVEKLKRRYSRRVARAKRAAEKAKRSADKSSDEASLSVEEVRDVSVESDEDSFSSAKDYYFSREELRPEFLAKKAKKEEKKKKKKFVPPIQMPRMWKEVGWEPSLNSIQEVSP